jgi:hypothetical protein
LTARIFSRRSSDGVQAVRDVVQLVGEQVPVQVQGHARRGVPEHLLDDLDVPAGRDRQ